MSNSVLFDLVSSLDKAELLRLGKFLRSPFVTHRSDVARLFASLAKCRYRGKSFPDKETLFRETFPGRAYDDLALRATMSDLRELIEDFLVWQHFQHDNLRVSMALMAQFRERNLPKHFEKAQRQTRRQLDDADIRNAEFHQKELDFLFESAQFKTRTMRTGELPLQEIADALDLHYLAQKLRHACTQLSHQAVYRTQYDLGLLPALIEQVEHSGFLRVPAIALYYYCYRFLTEQYSLSYFQKFRDELFENERLFPATELKSLYLLATNFCIRQLNEGNPPPSWRRVGGCIRRASGAGFSLNMGAFLHSHSTTSWHSASDWKRSQRWSSSFANTRISSNLRNREVLWISTWPGWNTGETTSPKPCSTCKPPISRTWSTT